MKASADWLRYSRYFWPWLRSQSGESNALADQVPWVNFEAKAWLDSVLTREMNVFEFGSGGSTIYFASRAKSVVSVEHESKWGELVRDRISACGLENCTLMLREPEAGALEDNGLADEERYASDFPGYERNTFRRYVTTIDSFQDKFFDLVLVDGRSRTCCLGHSIPKVRPGGFLILDNSERPGYAVAKSRLDRWKRIEFFGPGPYEPDFCETTVWQRPTDEI